jgi:phage shock protein A
MGIFSRLADIVNANLNSVLDRAEDPEKMIRQMIHEMTDTLVEVRANAARMIADRKGLERRRQRLGEVQRDWAAKAELALSKGREDLARAALVEKSRLAEDVRILEQELGQLDDAMARYDEDIAKLEAKLREAKAKQKAILARHATAKSRLQVRRQVHDRRIDEAFVRFEQMERRLDGIEGEVEVFDLGRTKTLAEEIDELAADETVDAELQALRSKLGKAGPAAPTARAGRPDAAPVDER